MTRAIAHFTLATRDPKATSDFLSATLGWSPIERPGNIRQTVTWLEINADQQVHLIEVEGFEPSPFEDEFGRHVAVFHDIADFPALKERLAANGAELIEPKRETPHERFFFRDPNGYVFEVMERT
jgi:catechol 2,3-dioxygenase-like lactoylglutathione lyase family enzyme